MRAQRQRMIGSIVLWLAAAASPAGAQYAYVGNQISGDVSVIDTATDTVVATIPTGAGAWGTAVAPVGSSAYVTNNTAGSVSFINTASNTVDATITGLSGAVGVAITPAGDRLYVGTSPLPTVRVISTATGLVMTTIPVSGGAMGVAAHPFGLEVYVSNYGDDQVSVIDTATNTVTATIPVGDEPRGIAVNPAGTRAYTANFEGDTVSVLGVGTGTATAIATIPVGDGAWGVAVSPDGARVYATNFYDETVSVIDAGTNTVVATIPVDGVPLGLTVHPDNSRVYVACPAFYPDAVCVIDTGTNTQLYRIPVGTTPIGMGQFIAAPSSAAASTSVATGTLSLTLSYPTLTGTLAFNPGPVSIFGTTVDVAAALGPFPTMSVTGSVLPIPGGLGVSTSATSSYVPSFSLSGTGKVVFTPNGAYDVLVTIPHGTPTGSVLPSGPAYTLTAALDNLGSGSYTGPFTLSAELAANTPEGTDVTVPVTSTVNLCPGSVFLATPVTVTYDAVTTAGSTFVTGTCKTPGSVPANLRLDLGGLQFFFDVSTSAAFTAPVTICIGYPDKDPDDGKVDGTGIDETKLVLLHDSGGAGQFQPAGSNAVDTVLNRVCAEVNDLSPFALGAQDIPRGFIPPDSGVQACEHAVLKEAAKLVKRINTCNRKAAEATLLGKPFDADGCEVKARGKYDAKIAGLGGCPACVATNAPAIRDAAENLAETANPALYCAGSTGLGGDALGFVPPDSAAAYCAKQEGKGAAKLTKRLTKCYRRLVDAAAESQTFDVDACLATSAAGFDTAVGALAGCPTCTAGGAPLVRNQTERFVAEILDDVYCAGTVEVP